jgi:hypothetical protein
MVLGAMDKLAAILTRLFPSMFKAGFRAKPGLALFDLVGPGPKDLRATLASTFNRLAVALSRTVFLVCVLSFKRCAAYATNFTRHYVRPPV